MRLRDLTRNRCTRTWNHRCIRKQGHFGHHHWHSLRGSETWNFDVYEGSGAEPFIDARRIPYDILADPKYNRENQDLDSFWNRIERDARSTPWGKRFVRRVQWKWRNQIKYRLRPRTYTHKLYLRWQSLTRGYSDWDLDGYSVFAMKMAIDACDYHAYRSWTYASAYVDDPYLKPERPEDNPDFGRGVEGYRQDLMKVKSSFQHRLAALDMDEKCTCCEDWCRDSECPIIMEGWELYGKLFTHMWD